MNRKGPRERIPNPESYYWVAARILYRTVERNKMIQVIDDLEPLALLKKGRYRDSLIGDRKRTSDKTDLGCGLRNSGTRLLKKVRSERKRKSL
jgi:hypothetical protein